MIEQGKAKHPVREIVLHCAAINTGQFAHMAPFQVWSTINQWHRERGFARGFGYHGLFMPDGHFEAGRPFSVIGAHVQGHNAGTLGFLMIERKKIYLPEGKSLEDMHFYDWFTDAQRKAVRAKIASIDGIWKVSGHNDYAPKLCPGFRVHTKDWL